MNILGAHVKGKADGLTEPPEDGQIARYNASTNQWEAYTMTAADIAFESDDLEATNVASAIAELFGLIPEAP